MEPYQRMLAIGVIGAAAVFGPSDSSRHGLEYRVQRELSSNHKVIVQFSQDKCGLCSDFSENILRAKKGRSDVSFYDEDLRTQQDVAAAKRLANEYGFNLTAVPAHLCAEDGAVDKQSSGYVSQDLLDNFLERPLERP